MDELRLCEDCGTKLAADAKSCPTCGLNLEVQADWEERVSSELVEDSFPLPPEHARSGEVETSSRRTNPRNYGGFGSRVVAYIIDSIVTTAVVYGVLIAAVIVLGVVGDFDMDEFFMDMGNGAMPVGVLLGFYGLSIGIPWIYFAMMESSGMQATLGKKLVNLKVTNLSGERITFGRASGRYFGKILSSMTMGIGFLMVAFTAKKQGLHDIVASTLVLKG